MSYILGRQQCVAIIFFELQLQVGYVSKDNGITIVLTEMIVNKIC